MSKIRYLSKITKIGNTSSPDIKHFFISRPTDNFNYTAGQWIEVFMASKTDTTKMLCTGFSMITSDQKNGSDLEFAIKNSDCEIVKWLHSDAKVGDSITMSSAQGIMTYPNPNLNAAIKAIVLISGGIGVTPHLAILDSIYRRKEWRDVWFVHQTRLGCEHIFRDRVETMNNSCDNLTVIYLCTQDTTPEHRKRDYDRVSLSLLKDSYGVPISETLFYVSGPPLMVKNFEDQLIVFNVDPNRCITEKW